MDALEQLLADVNKQVLTGTPLIVNIGNKPQVNPALQLSTVPLSAAAAPVAVAAQPGAAAVVAPLVPQPAVVAQPGAAAVVGPLVPQPAVVAQPGAAAVVAQPGAAAVVAQPVAAQPVAAQPVAAQPVAVQPVAAQPVVAQPQGPCDLPANLLIKYGIDFNDRVELINKIYNIKRVFDIVTARTEGTLKFIENDYSKDQAKLSLLTKTKLVVNTCRRNMQEIWGCARARQTGFSWDIDDVTGTMNTIMMRTPAAWTSISGIIDALPNKGKDTFIRIFYTLDRLILEADIMSTNINQFLELLNIEVDSVGLPIRHQPGTQTSWQWLRGQPATRAPIGIPASLGAYSQNMIQLLNGASNENILVPLNAEKIVKEKMQSFPLFLNFIPHFNGNSPLYKYFVVAILAHVTLNPLKDFNITEFERLLILEYALSYLVNTMRDTLRNSTSFTKKYSLFIDNIYPNSAQNLVEVNRYLKQVVEANTGINSLTVNIRTKIQELRTKFTITEPPTRPIMQAVKNRWFGGSKKRRVRKGRPSKRR